MTTDAEHPTETLFNAYRTAREALGPFPTISIRRGGITWPTPETETITADISWGCLLGRHKLCNDRTCQCACHQPEETTMTDETTTIDDYAIDLVTSGARNYIQDDLNESETINDDDWPAARERANAIVRAIEEHADQILAWADHSQTATEQAPT